MWDFKRTISSLLYTQSNGLEEKTIKNILRKYKNLLLGLLIHQTTPGKHGLLPAEILMGKKLRNNLPELTKNSNINVSLKEKDRQKAKQKFYFDRQSTRELELLKPGDLV